MTITKIVESRSEAFNKGYQSYEEGLGISDNPYVGSDVLEQPYLADEWLKGYKEAKNEEVETPYVPSEAQWSGLARDLMLAFDMQLYTPRKILENFRLSGIKVPEWLLKEKEMQNLDHALSKGTRCVLIYRAMCAITKSGKHPASVADDIFAPALSKIPKDNSWYTVSVSILKDKDALYFDSVKVDLEKDKSLRENIYPFQLLKVLVKQRPTHKGMQLKPTASIIDGKTLIVEVYYQHEEDENYPREWMLGPSRRTPPETESAFKEARLSTIASGDVEILEEITESTSHEQ